ncbi:MAG: TRAP transporter small permease [Pseudomonadota bacterium]
MFDRLHTSLSSLARGAATVGGLAMCGAAFMVTLDVLSRKLFGVTLRGADEITGYVFACTTTWAFAHALMTRSHIRIDAAYTVLGTPMRALLDVLGLGLLTLYIGLLTRSAWSVVTESVRYDYTAQTPLATPLWLPQSVWFAGLAFMSVCLAFLMVRALWLVARRDWQAINAFAGVRSLDQDIAEETHA